MLTESQIESLILLVEQDLSYAPLKEELLDHLCCAIEDEMLVGHCFATAQDRVIARFGEEGLLGVQTKTLDILTHNSKRMKHLMYLGSLAASITLIMMVSVFSQQLPTQIPMEGKISSEFGPRIHKKNKKKQYHTGIDIKAEEGTPVYAAANGAVEHASESGDYGLLVKLSHDGNYATRYAHLSRIVVEAGTRVKQGDLIAYCGSTGKSIRPHLHYEVRKDGKAINPREVWEQ